MRELDISDSCHNCRQQHVTKVYFHSHLGEYRGTIMVVLWVFTPCWKVSSDVFRGTCCHLLQCGWIWFSLMVKHPQYWNKLINLLPKTPEHFHSSNTYHQNLKTCKEVQVFYIQIMLSTLCWSTSHNALKQDRNQILPSLPATAFCLQGLHTTNWPYCCLTQYQ